MDRLLDEVAGDGKDDEGDSVSNEGRSDEVLGGISVGQGERRELANVLAETVDDHARADDGHAENLDELVVLVADEGANATEGSHDGELGDSVGNGSAKHQTKDAAADESEDCNTVLHDEGSEDVGDTETADDGKDTTNDKRSGASRVESEADAEDDGSGA